MKDYDLEQELAAAMLDRSRQEPPGGYDVDGLVGSVRRRRRRLQAGAAAAVAIVALGAGFLSRADHDRVSLPVQAPTAPSAVLPPAPPPVEPPSASPSPSASASDSASKPADPARTTSTLFLAALRYQNPAARSQVDLVAVAALFADESTYQRIWGADSTGATCGSSVDGVLVAGEVLLYQGVERLDRAPSPTFDATGKVTDLTCRTVAGGSKGGGDPTVSGFYGGLVAAAKSGDSTAMSRLGRQFVTANLRSVQGPTAGTCSSATTPFWLADNPSSGTLTHGWTVNLGGPYAFPIEIDENAKIATSCGK
ncbi:hypothetical protein [Kitasatospora purpeofusca]|uniref:hypothetical protein n=1 Tax=Kitasatospora purpeofusca TaxID=67352 RepID=UPI00224E3BBC|nr:hypothetical protein [Kitasatospora purpeofusca]MCX4757364.1 hypothetical protein [Kitasatospora purpeofusca]WSR34896.1 hypothetical protein OG715_30410 [Kitasatospora purpeofusca]WSR43114.1 hypothetical protein OG196_30920 [Kitasatospora purpeofusca]